MQPTQESDDIDVPLTSMSVDDLRKLKGLYEQSVRHYESMLKEKLKEGDILAVKMCMEELEQEMREIDLIIANKIDGSLPQSSESDS